MDLRIIESNNGGDLFKKRRDLCVIEGLENMVYLALFGGNVEASTQFDRLENEQAFDWWGNRLFHQEQPGIQINSLTERTLMSVSLTSAGRVSIEDAVKRDLDFMRPFTRVSVAVTIPASDKVAIGVRLEQPDNLDQRQFVYIWDATRQELLTSDVGCGQETIDAGVTPEGIGYWFIEEDFVVS